MKGRDKNLFAKISSKYICEKILDFIYDENFKYKLFNYSKFFQKKLDINLFDYFEIFVEQCQIDIQDYLFNEDNIIPSKFDKEIYNKKLIEDLKKNNIESKIMNEYMLNKLKKESKKENVKKYHYLNFDSGKYNIDIYLPFFDLISKSQILETNRNISIPIKVIKTFDLLKDYNLVFNKMNKSKIIYRGLVINFGKYNNINLLNKL